MARITVEDCLEEVENRFLLVHLAAKRTKQLKNGAGQMIEPTDNKDVVNALREIAAGKVSFENINELNVPKRDPFDSYVEEERKEDLDDFPEDSLEESLYPDDNEEDE
ncbi:MAG: DNA-directed RNA polymerase subunit omega [Deltaproteobacteria bacterium]|uniref:DNA-directed RNA polymerase subunit omega n=1 Tax=Candidatus Zymogenus saltonus TaxID=2844893 RepID=A0A9D8KDH2_9DELT|nr:DNA-directed RNA polymerase subunit omega [Candidatus Zymogenus saltonus]